MAKIDRFFTLSFEPAKAAVPATKDKPAQPASEDSVTVSLDLVGTTEMEHELLMQFFTARSVSLVPFNVGDKMESRFVIVAPGSFSKAQRATENRIRVRDGRPTVEQEEQVKAAKLATKPAEPAKVEAKPDEPPPYKASGPVQ
jgi:hypothetical protein